MKRLRFKLFSGYRVKDSDPNPEDALLFQKANDLSENEKVYLSKDVNLSDVALRCCSNKTYLSHAINTVGKCGFKGWINGSRIQTALDIAQKDPYISVSELADRSGFGTVVTFNKWFRKEVGTTPGRYLKELRMKGR